VGQAARDVFCSSNAAQNVLILYLFLSFYVFSFLDFFPFCFIFCADDAQASLNGLKMDNKCIDFKENLRGASTEVTFK
jgi:hypothetical protein